MDTTSDRLWSVHDVADYLGIPHKTLYNWRTRGIGPRAAASAATCATRNKTSEPGSAPRASRPVGAARCPARPHRSARIGAITHTQRPDGTWSARAYIRDTDGNVAS